MSTRQREAIDLFYRQSEMPGSTPTELRVSFARNMAHFAAPDGITLLQVGGNEMLFDDSVRMAARAAATLDEARTAQHITTTAQ